MGPQVAMLPITIFSDRREVLNNLLQSLLEINVRREVAKRLDSNGAKEWR